MTKVHYDAKAAVAARAIYPQIRGMLPRIAITIDTYEGHQLEIEFDHDIVAALIDQMTHAYNASLPTIKTKRNK